MSCDSNRTSAFAVGIAMLVSLGSAIGSHAAVTTTSSTILADTSARSYSSGDAFFAGYFADRVAITGLQKFDPSLGTLTGVALSVSYDYTYGLNLTSGPVTDSGQAHQAKADFSNFVFLVGNQIGTNTTVLHQTSLATNSLTAAGAAGAPPAGNSSSASGTLATSLKNVTGSLNLANFTGTGDVDSIIVATYLPYSGAFTLTNVDSATAQSSAGRTAGTISLQYTYNTAVPEPATLALTAAAFAGFLRRRR